MSRNAQRKRSPRAPITQRRFEQLRRFGIPIGRDGRLYAPYKRWGADWKAGVVVTEKQQKQIIAAITEAQAVANATGVLEDAAGEDRITPA